MKKYLKKLNKNAIAHAVKKTPFWHGLHRFLVVYQSQVD
jgi:hypothetical protein